jgi:anti-anti-sigma factor
MTETLKVKIERRDGVAVIYTEGYINNQGGEEVARAAGEVMEEGFRALLLNLEGSKIVNSIGISILIEVLERMLELDGTLAFCSLTPTIQKTFHIMGLTQYAKVFPDEPTALAEIAAGGAAARA